jgi:hypothetical protein
MRLHIGYLRMLEDSERIRAACVRYLQSSLLLFYPDKPVIVSEAQELARELDGELEGIRMPWKYSWIQRLFGWRAAKRGQLWLLGLRWSTERLWDRALLCMARSRPWPT